MTDESNRKAAFDFLKQLADRQHNEEKLEELPSKIEFNKHVTICNTKGKLFYNVVILATVIL